MACQPLANKYYGRQPYFQKFRTVGYNILTMKTMPTNAPRPDAVMSPDARQAVELFMARLHDLELPGITKVLLYGSHARGDHRTDSDVDIAVVLAGSDPGNGVFFDIMMQLAAVRSRIMTGMENPVYVEAFVVWENELRQPEKQRNPAFFRNVLADGVEIT